MMQQLWKIYALEMLCAYSVTLWYVKGGTDSKNCWSVKITGVKIWSLGAVPFGFGVGLPIQNFTPAFDSRDKK